MEEIFVPASGMAMEDALLVEWLKGPGDLVEPGEAVAVVETDKSTVELSAQSRGRLSHHLFSTGARVPAGATIAYVLNEAEPVPRATVGSLEPPDRDRGSAEGVATGVPPPFNLGRLPEEGVTRGAAAAQPEVGVTALSSPTPPGGSGAVGGTRRTERDDEGRHRLSPRRRREAAAVGTAMSLDTGVPVERKATAEFVTQSWLTMPHFSVCAEVRAEGLLRLVEQSRAEGIDASVTDLLLRALAFALVEVGQAPDVGLAVATQWGVLVPVLHDVRSLPLAELSAARRRAVERARSRLLISGDAATPFATLSNLGMERVRWFTGVVPAGQVALLTVGRIAARPIAEGSKVVVAQAMDAVLTADHRRYDGVDSVRLLSQFVDYIEALEAGAK
jgi:pyruvate dehydrogenase E2 component (dihydrolipoamide acetyltransferase)